MNQARDLGPQSCLPIITNQNKVNNDWQYGIISTWYCSIHRAVCAAFFVRYYLGYFYLNHYCHCNRKGTRENPVPFLL